MVDFVIKVFVEKVLVYIGFELNIDFKEIFVD